MSDLAQMILASACAASGLLIALSFVVVVLRKP